METKKKARDHETNHTGLFFLCASRYCALKFSHKTMKLLVLVMIRNTLLEMAMQKASWKFEI